MPESAFKGTVLEGRERRYTVLNDRDLKKYVTKNGFEEFQDMLDDVLIAVEFGRKNDGKKPYNSYIVINVDEPYIDEIIEVMKRNGHWGQGDKVLKWSNGVEWGEIKHPELGMVMTYWRAGTPCYDTYTAPRVTSDGDIYCERYCHDDGMWKDTIWIGEHEGEEEIAFC